MPATEKPDITCAEARKIARSLNHRQVCFLRAVVDRDLQHGWSDKRTTDALHARGLVTYTTSPISRHVGGGVYKTRLAITDVKATESGRLVLDIYDLLATPGVYNGRELGAAQKNVLDSLSRHHNGRWWPGCGWSWNTPAATVQILDSLESLGLATRGTTEAGAPMFEITRMGRIETRPLAVRLAEVRAARAAQ